MKKVITTKNAPSAIGPYSQAILIEAKEMLFISGQIPIDPATGEVVSSDVKEQASQVLKNIKAILKEAGMDMENIIKTTIFLKDMSRFSDINEVYRGFFGEGDYPARSTIEVLRLPRDVEIEIEAIAVR